MKAVILAGGRGTRLMPYTTSFPKPLMPVGEKPILELVIEQLKKNGFKEIIMAVGHMAELIVTFFGDGSKYGVKITYHREEEPLGTAGALRQIKNQLPETFLLMNGDVLSDVDFSGLMRFHKESGVAATICLTKRTQSINYGTVEINEEGLITSWKEKPAIDFLVSTGIYVLESKVVDHIPAGRFDLPDLVLELLKAGQKVQGYMHGGYWLDIGRPDDYQKACEDIGKILKEG